MDIRCFQEKDRHAVITLWHECGLTVPQNDPNKDIDRKLQVNPELFLVGLRNNEIIATVMGGYEGHRGWINYLAVKPSAQRQGFARHIMQAVEEKIALTGCPKINLQVRTRIKVSSIFMPA